MHYKEEKIISTIPPRSTIFFVSDSGGTNTRFCFFLKKNKTITPLIFFYLTTDTISSFEEVAYTLVERCKKIYHQSPSRACFAIAGVVNEEKNYGKLTHQKLIVDAKKIEQHIAIPVTIINDVEAFAWGLDVIPSKNIVPIMSSAKKIPHALHQKKAIIAAGTGLGKSLLIWDTHAQHYLAYASEGGHADFPIHTQLEWELTQFITQKKKLKTHYPLIWEDVLSGTGLQHIYLFLDATKQYKKTAAHQQITKNNYDPRLITSHHKTDAQCHNAFSLFIRFYGRCAKNFALETLSLGGIYLAGGIAAAHYTAFKNNSFFKKEFLQNKKYKTLLQQIPVFIITNTDAALFGAGNYLLILEQRSY